MVSHKIELRLNSSGFSAEDLGTVLPDFMTERKTIIGLTWYPSAEGPASYVLIVTILYLIGTVPKIFVEELSKDLYKWTKNKLLNLFHKKHHSCGSVKFVFKDVTIEYFCEDADTLLPLFENLPKIIAKIDSEKGTEWEIEIDNGQFSLKYITRP